MVNRVQTLRSSTAGTVPASGTRQPGELWLNFADKNLGYIDASQVAQKVLAVRFFSTLTSYVAGDIVWNGGALYAANGAITPGAFNAGQWQLIGGIGFSYLPTAGGTLTGQLVVSAGGVSVTGGGLGVTAGAVNLSPANSNVTVSPTGTGTLTANPATLGHIDNVAIGQTTPAAVKTNALSASGGNIDNVVIGATVPAAASVTSMNGGQLAGERNMIINGRGLIDQRNNNVSTTPGSGGYFGDRWAYYGTQLSKFSVVCGTSIGGNLNGARGCLNVTVAAVYTPVTNDVFQLYQVIEGQVLSRLGWGTPSAFPATFSFDINCNVAGTYCVRFANSNSTRVYVAPFTVPTANTWYHIALTIPGDTAGTWAIDNTAGLGISWMLGYGPNYVGTGNVWGSTNIVATAGSVNLVTQSGGSLNVTNVQFEQGTVATPFEARLYATELLNCMRYYYFDAVGIMTYNNSGITTVISGQLYWPVRMRATPTLTTGSTVNNASLNMNTLVAYQSTPPGWFQTGYISANAEL